MAGFTRGPDGGGRGAVSYHSSAVVASMASRSRAIDATLSPQLAPTSAPARVASRTTRKKLTGRPYLSRKILQSVLKVAYGQRWFSVDGLVQSASDPL